ncbi:MAG: hypothetical protein ACM3SY_21735 [Candidatus Omnitrophota bacterium]
MELVKKKGPICAVFLIIFAIGTTALFSINLQPIEKIEFSPNTELPQLARSFCVTENGTVVIPDAKAGEIKVYERNGKYLEFIKSVGQKGMGADQFAEPIYCSYNNDGKLVVYDIGQRKVLIYDNAVRVCEIYCPWGGSDFKLVGNTLFIAGYTEDANRKPWDFYAVDILSKEVTYLLPSYLKYGLKSEGEYKSAYESKNNFQAIGINGWFDIQGQSSYFVWEGDINAIKLDINSGASRTFNSQKPAHYIKPYVSDALIKGRMTKDAKTIRDERSKLTYARNLLVTDKYVIIICEGPIKDNYWMQFYTLSGQPVGNEVRVPGPADYRMHFDKDTNCLYFLSQSTDGKYYINKYAIK